MKAHSNPRLQIIRGLPGSGKSSLAVAKYPHLSRVETDMFFMRGGKYIFTLDLNKKAVKWFNKTVHNFAKVGMDFVVTGVFAAHTERLNNVVVAGLENGYDVYIKTLVSDFGNIHNVPKEHLKAMKDSFVSDRQLQKIYRPQGVHFGLMPSRFSV